jgi:nitrite reductase/ring-hydroxylating ferredoxin subunit
MTSGAYLGGHLSFGTGVDVNRTAGAAAGPVDAGAGRRRTGRRAALQGRRRAGPAVRTEETVYALDSTCTHTGGPLEEGTISDGCIICRGTAAPSGSPTAPSCAARPARRSPATRRASRTGASRSAPLHNRSVPQPPARVVPEDTVLTHHAQHGPCDHAARGRGFMPDFSPRAGAGHQVRRDFPNADRKDRPRSCHTMPTTAPRMITTPIASK